MWWFILIPSSSSSPNSPHVLRARPWALHPLCFAIGLGWCHPQQRQYSPPPRHSVFSHTHRSSEWHTLRRDASWVSQVLPMTFIYLLVYFKSGRAVRLVLKPGLFMNPFYFWNTWTNELAGKALHIWIIPTHRVLLLGPLQTWGFLIPLRINDEHTTGLPLLM